LILFKTTTLFNGIVLVFGGRCRSWSKALAGKTDWHGNRAVTIIATTGKIAAKEFAMTILPRHPSGTCHTDESLEKYSL
jgi:hypothetical protein